MGLPTHVLRLSIIAGTDVRPASLPAAPTDVLVSCGDLFDDTIAWYAEWLQPRYIVAVRGPRDQRVPFPDDVEDLHGRVVDIEGCLFAGFGGGLPGATAINHAFSDDEAAAALVRVPRVDVLLTSAPPPGVHEETGPRADRGFASFTTYMERARPAFLLHASPAACRRTVVGDTRVVGTHGFRSLVVARP